MIPPDYLAYCPTTPIRFREQSYLVPLAPTRSKKRYVEAIAMMVTIDITIGPPKAKVGRPKMIVDAKSPGQKLILAFLSERS